LMEVKPRTQTVESDVPKQTNNIQACFEGDTLADSKMENA